MKAGTVKQNLLKYIPKGEEASQDGTRYPFFVGWCFSSLKYGGRRGIGWMISICDWDVGIAYLGSVYMWLIKARLFWFG